MRALSELLNAVLAGLGLAPGPWVVPLVGVLAVLVMYPMFQANHSTRQARRRLMLAASAPRTAERERLKAEALALVLGNPIGVAVVGDEALRQGWNDLAVQALHALEQCKGRPEDIRSLRRRLEGRSAPMPTAEALAVERLLEAGLQGQAAARLEAALARWPEHHELTGLRERVLAREQAREKAQEKAQESSQHLAASQPPELASSLAPEPGPGPSALPDQG